MTWQILGQNPFRGHLRQHIAAEDITPEVFWIGSALCGHHYYLKSCKMAQMHIFSSLLLPVTQSQPLTVFISSKRNMPK